jgi:DNA-binding GntR family transcriptional regulator
MIEAALRPIPKKSLREEAYEKLRRAIVEGAIRPQEQLSEPQLAEKFQTSRSPIREALGRLEQEGFVLRRPNGRLHVAPLDIEELEQLYALRANVEGLATRLAAPRLSTIDLDAMAQKIRSMEESAAKGDIVGSLESGAQFHDAILRRCGNRPLTDVVEGVRLRIDRFRAFIASARNQDVRVAEHWRIYEALYSRKPKAAERAMIAHIEQSARAILKAARSEKSL